MLNFLAKLAMMSAVMLNILLIAAVTKKPIIPYDAGTYSPSVISAVILDTLLINKTV